MSAAVPGTFLSIAKYAERHGVSRQAVYKWRKQGWLVLDASGRVDVAQSDARLEVYRDGSDARATRDKAPAVVEAPTPTTVDPAAVALRRILATTAPPTPPAPLVLGGERLRAGAFGAPTDDETPAQAAERLVRLMGAQASTEEARRIKENYLALRGKLEYERDSGDLVAIRLAEKVLFDQFRAIRDAWMSWPSNFGAEIAADLNLDADRVTEVLTGYVHRQIEALGEPRGRFGED